MMVLWAYGFVSPSGFVRAVLPAAEVLDRVTPACPRNTTPEPIISFIEGVKDTCHVIQALNLN